MARGYYIGDTGKNFNYSGSHYINTDTSWSGVEIAMGNNYFKLTFVINFNISTWDDEEELICPTTARGS